ncbi:MAG: glycosyltransferase family 4 protein [Phycisphaerales bacterium JB040]
MSVSRGLSVVVNDRPLLGRRTGVGRYLEGVLSGWPGQVERPRGVVGGVGGLGETVRVRPGYGGVDSIAPLRLCPLSELRPRADGRVGVGRRLRRKGYALAARSALRVKRQAGCVVWEPNHHPLVGPRQESPVVTTVHDLSVVTRPEFHPPDRVRAWERALARTLDRTSRFIGVSRAPARAIERELGVARARIDAIPLASRYDGRPEGWGRAACRAALGLAPDAGVVVHLGTIEPRKNIGGLLDSWRVVLERCKRAELVLVGGAGWGSESFWSGLTGHPVAGRVGCAGYLDDARTLALLIAADVVVCPSWLEGFGLPVVEAASVGTPVLVSRDPALVEAYRRVGGDPEDALDAWDTPGWGRRIASVLGGEVPGVAMPDRGWEDVAREHVRAFASAARDG